MKISNFELTATTKNNVGSDVFHATIDIETGMLWWKKKRTVEIRRTLLFSTWFFVETGRWILGDEVNALARTWSAKTGEEI